MRSLIVFCSSHGTTEKAAKMVSENLTGDVEIVNLKKNPNIDLHSYDAVILGGSIHAGTIQAKIKQFVSTNLNTLTAKKFGLFICCMHEEKAQEQFDNAFPKELRDAALAKGLFGGEFIFSKMNFFERLIVKKVSGISEDTSTLDSKEIKKFAGVFN